MSTARSPRILFGPGGLVLAVDRGSEAFLVDRDGPHLAYGRSVTVEEDAALSLGAGLIVERLAARGFVSRVVVSASPSRRRIDLLLEPEGEAPPEARTDELLAAMKDRLAAMEDRLACARIAGLSEVVSIAVAAAADAGIADPKVAIDDARHLEIGITDKSDSGQWLMRWLWQRGIAPDRRWSSAMASVMRRACSAATHGCAVMPALARASSWCAAGYPSRRASIARRCPRVSHGSAADGTRLPGCWRTRSRDVDEVSCRSS